MRHNFMFETKWNYTFGEVISAFLTQSSATLPITAITFKMILTRNGFSSSNQNPYGLSFLDGDSNPTDLSVVFINKLNLRYKSHYALQLDENLEITSDEFIDKARNDILTKIINKLDYTYAKYSLLLNEYESQKSHLLDKLSRVRSGSRELSQEAEHSEESNKLSLYNDTPQTTDIVANIEGNQFVSDLTKGHDTNEGSNSSSGTDEYEETETWDNVPIMARLEEVEKKFSNLWQKWLNEFDELFVEEVNY